MRPDWADELFAGKASLTRRRLVRLVSCGVEHPRRTSMSSARGRHSETTVLRLALVASVWTACWLIAVTLFWRRAAGAFEASLSPLAACSVTAVLLFVSFVALALLPARLPNDRGGRFSNTLDSPLLLVLAFGPGVLTASALTPRYSGAPLVLQAVLLLLGLAGLSALWWNRRSSGVAARAAGVAATGEPDTTSSNTQTAGVLGEGTTPLTSPTSESCEEADVLQQLVRHRATDGTETLEGTVRLSLARGQKQTVFHLLFSPPFARTPDISCEPVSETSARVKIGLVAPYGVRLEVRRAEAADEETLELAVRATAFP